MNPDPITPQYREGIEARMLGLPLDANPYPVPEPGAMWEYRDTRKRQEWREGWFQKDTEMMEAKS
jgi:hypothetical protein